MEEFSELMKKTATLDLILKYLLQRLHQNQRQLLN